jgi:hypothetical protein
MVSCRLRASPRAPRSLRPMWLGGVESPYTDNRACDDAHGRRGTCRPGRLNGGSRAASARRGPSSIHPGIASSSAPARRHSWATASALAVYSGPFSSAVPSASPAASASRSARPPASSRSSAAPAAISSSGAAPQCACRWAMLASRALRSRSLSGPGRERVTLPGSNTRTVIARGLSL